jgi:hypothetical protein
VKSITFSPDGSYLAGSDHPGEVFLWRVRDGRLVLHLRQNREGGFGSAGSYALLYYSPNRLAFSPDGRLLAYVTDHKTVRLWDLKKGQDLLVLKNFPSSVDRLYFSPDGGRLLAVDSRPRWHVWDARPLPGRVAYARLARKRVEALFQEALLKGEIRDRLKSDPKLSPPARRVALRLMNEYHVNAERLNEASWDVVRYPGATPAAYRRALRQAQAACGQEPKEAAYVNTLAAAWYRVGNYQKALKTLQRERSLFTPQYKGWAYANPAFFALSYHRLGQHRPARVWLLRLRRHTKKTRDPDNEQDYQSLLREADRLIDSKRPAAR